jgi:predicted kinase
VTLPRPPWEFRSQSDILKFKAWVNQKLDQMDEPTAEDFRRELEIMNDESYMDAVEKAAARTLKRGRVINAARNRDVRALARLTANDHALKDLAVGVLARVRGRGREKGEARPRDISPIESALLEDAFRDLERIRWLCQKYWQGRWKGSSSVAIEIAAKRGHVDVDQLINFKKNRARNSHR